MDSSLSSASVIGIGLEIWARAILGAVGERTLGMLLTAAALDDRGMSCGESGDVDDRCILYFSKMLRRMTFEEKKKKKERKTKERRNGVS